MKKQFIKLRVRRMDEITKRKLHEEAVKFRQKKRMELVNGEMPKEDYWIYTKMEEMFPKD
jgi:hypothetical protein